MFGLQGLFPCPPGTASFLPSDLFNPRLFGVDKPRSHPFDPIHEKATGEKSVQRLRSFLLAFNGEAGRQMNQKDTGRGLVDFLPSGSGGTNKGLPELFLPNAETLHPLPERFLLVL